MLIIDHFETRRSSLMAGLVALLGATFMLCFGRSEAVLIVARVLQGISAAVVWTVGNARFRTSGLTRRASVDCRHGPRGTSESSCGVCVLSDVNWSYSWSRSRWDHLRSVRVLCGFWSFVWVHWIGLGIEGDTCGEEDCCAIYWSISPDRRPESRGRKVTIFAGRSSRHPRNSGRTSRRLSPFT